MKPVRQGCDSSRVSVSEAEDAGGGLAAFNIGPDTANWNGTEIRKISSARREFQCVRPSSFRRSSALLIRTKPSWAVSKSRSVLWRATSKVQRQ